MLVILKVTLPEEFPFEAPVIVVSPPVSHRWVDRDMQVVGHESLATWSTEHCLGKILKDIELEFNLRPPQILHGFVPSHNSNESSSVPEPSRNNLEISLLTRFS